MTERSEQIGGWRGLPFYTRVTISGLLVVALIITSLGILQMVSGGVDIDTIQGIVFYALFMIPTIGVVVLAWRRPDLTIVDGIWAMLVLLILAPSIPEIGWEKRTPKSDKIERRRCQYERCPQGRYTREFRQEAVKLVTEERLSLPEAARRLSLAPSTLGYWVKAQRAGKLGDVGKTYRPLTEVEMDLARTKKELAEVKMERDILKKAAAYFAKESLPGTRR